MKNRFKKGKLRIKLCDRLRGRIQPGFTICSIHISSLRDDFWVENFGSSAKIEHPIKAETIYANPDYSIFYKI